MSLALPNRGRHIRLVAAVLAEQDDEGEEAAARYAAVGGWWSRAVLPICEVLGTLVLLLTVRDRTHGDNDMVLGSGDQSL